jgi:OFA family oxalate/formate antiporter-like MFS transporter
MNLALGSLYAWSVFVAPLEKEFGWKRADTSSVFGWAVIVFALSFILAGRLQDRLGPFKVSLVGSILLTVGFVLCAYTTSLTYLIICFGILVGIGNGFGYATPIPVMAKWFPDKRGLAVGLAVAGYGGGSAIFGPMANLWLIPHYGWRSTFTILGVVFFGMTLVGSFLLKNPPVGYRPEGWTPAPASKVAATTYEFSPSETLRTPTFYFMWIAYALGTFGGFMVISQLVPFAKSMQIPAGALTAITLVIGAAGNASGRILSGWMSDALGRLNVLRLMIGVSAVAMPVLYLVGNNVTLLYVMVFIVYWCYGTQLSVNGAATSDFWGTKNAGINYGMLFTAWGLTGYFASKVAGKLFEQYKNYQAAFYTAAALAVVALIFELLAKRPAPPVGAASTAAANA